MSKHIGFDVSYEVIYHRKRKIKQLERVAVNDKMQFNAARRDAIAN